MKTHLLLILLLLAGRMAAAQDSTQAAAPRFGLGDGFTFSVNEDQYRFKISGLLQPSYLYTQTDGQKAQNFLRTKRAYVNFGGVALKEKVSFFVQANFSDPLPLLDAWVAYNPAPGWQISAGQRRTFTNNRELTFDEDKLQFTDRGLLSQAFAGNGREFGLFVTGRIGKGFVVVPQAAVTSGDGPNSFGQNASDVDLGGLKYGGRLDVYPLGEFSEGNRGFAADLRHESSPKVLLGAAASLNNGASSPKGEGHGDFLLYNAGKGQQLPNYRKLSLDILLKYQGLSILSEYTNASAAHLQGLYTDTTASPASILRPGQISQYLVLGNAWNVQAGYVTRTGYALDLRYESLRPEFTDEALSQLQQARVSTVGLSKYFRDNKLKLQGSFSSIQYQNSVHALRGELMLQVVF